ncbi:MAG TPA: homoserine kinase [Anaerolineales bacterium]|nr:homoserine kinase [Anaerolineales bacterium]
MDSQITAELKEVLAHYALGELIEYEQNERGFVNTAYEIYTLAAGQRHRYFLRKYKRGIREQELVFEHSLMDHLVAAGMPAARIYKTRSGKSYLHRFEGTDDSTDVFYTIFEYLSGEDRFTWVDPRLNKAQLSSSAAVLAQFHIDVGGFTPLGRRNEPKILDLLPVIAETWATCPSRSKGTIFDDHIHEYLEPVSANIAATLNILRECRARSLPEMVIHCDYHPGNLKFSGDRVSGVFDFDWSKVDLRLFDLGLALWYFCTSWQGSEDGSIRLDWADTFLRAYQKTLAKHPRGVRLTEDETRYLPALVNAGNLYVLHWTVLDYFSKDVDPAEYLTFLDHSLHFFEWYQQSKNCQALQNIACAVLAQTR